MGYNELRDVYDCFVGSFAARHFTVGHFSHIAVAIHGHIALLHLPRLAFVVMGRNRALIAHATSHGTGHPNGSGERRLQQHHSQEAEQSRQSPRPLVFLRPRALFYVEPHSSMILPKPELTEPN